MVDWADEQSRRTRRRLAQIDTELDEIYAHLASLREEILRLRAAGGRHPNDG